MHKLLNNWKQHQQRNLLSYRLLIYILICSTLLTIFSSGLQLYWDYRSDVDDIESEINSIEAGYLDSLSSSLWKLDQEQIDIQLDGIMKVPDVGYAAITEIVAGKKGNVFYRGEQRDDYPISNTFNLEYRDTLVGTLEISATLDNVYRRLFKKFLIILTSQAVKTFLVSIFILVIVHYLIVRHLNKLRRFTSRLDLTNLDEHLQLHKPRKSEGEGDAIDQLVDSINEMRDNISNQLAAKRNVQQELRTLNEELEQRVLYRTATLKHTNERLTQALGELTQTKDRLVESEKMAALGELVSGVSQEISQPVNNSLDALSSIQQRYEDLSSLESKPEAELSALKEDILQATETLDRNLNQASKLITTFKQIAVDQSHEITQRFNLEENLKSAIAELEPALKSTHCEIQVECDPKLEIISYPASFTQIYSNLILNSLTHGFEGRDEGNRIDIKIAREGSKILIDYSDNGKGVPEQIKHRLFDPFVTGKPGSGSGLGTHLIYNLITQLLKGSISADSERGEGTHFRIIIPTKQDNAPDDHSDDLW